MKGFLSISLLIWIPSSFASVPPTNFHVVVPAKVYRGALPTEDNIAYLSSIGVRTIINLVTTQSDIDQERQWANQAGIVYASVPLSGFWSPPSDRVNLILSIVNNPAYQPVYFHCRYGEDRTGLIAGMFRVFYQHWWPSHAYKEMLQNGFHQELIFLNGYFVDVTGYEPAYVWPEVI